MKLIEPSVEILEQSSGLNGIYEQIEIAGRTCYKSEDKITETSAKDFVDRMVASKHYAMLEHGTIYLYYKGHYTNNPLIEYFDNKHSKAISIGRDTYSDIYVTTNYRVLIENNWLDDLKYICEPTEYHEKRITSKFICDRGVSHELVRHRVFSFAQESTRYCNYSKDKFGNELTFILPSKEDVQYELNTNIDYIYVLCASLDTKDIFENIFYGVKEMDKDSVYYSFVKSLCIAETTYFNMLENGFKPQEARSILPNALKTEVVMTGFESDYTHFFELRCAKTAHPDMQVLANRLKELM